MHCFDGVGPDVSEGVTITTNRELRHTTSSRAGSFSRDVLRYPVQTTIEGVVPLSCRVVGLPSQRNGLPVGTGRDIDIMLRCARSGRLDRVAPGLTGIGTEGEVSGVLAADLLEPTVHQRLPVTADRDLRRPRASRCTV